VPVRKKSRSAGPRHRPKSKAPPDAEVAAGTVAKRVRQIAFGLVLLGTALGPLAPSQEGALVLRLIVQMFYVLAGALWLLGMALEGRVRLRRTGMGPWLILLAGALVSGVVNASYRYPAFLMAFAWFSGMIAFVVVLNEARTRRARLLALAVIAASAFTVSRHGIHQVFVEFPRARAAFGRDPGAILRELNVPPDMAYDLGGRIGKNRVFSTFLLPNSLAGFLVLAFPVGLGLAIDRFRRWRRRRSLLPIVLRGALLVPILAALFLTQSKGGAIAFAVSLVAFAVWGFSRLLWRCRMQALCAALSVVILAFIAEASGLIPPWRDYAGSSQVRYGYWRAGLAIFEERPFVGVGLDNFADYYARFKRPEDQEARRAHNDYIQLAAELGLIGVFAYGAFLVRFWLRVRRREGEPILPPEDEPDANAWGWGPILSLAGCVFAIEALCGGTFRSIEGLWGWTWPLVLALLWVAFALVFTHREDALGPVRNSYATIGIGAGLIGFYVHCLAEFHHYTGGILQTAWVLMGVLLASRLSEEKESFAVDRKIGSGLRLAMTLGSLCLTLLLMYGFILRVAEAQVLRERATDPNRWLSDEARDLDLQAAIESNPWDAYTYALRSDLLLTMWVKGKLTTARGRPTFSEAVNSARDAARIDDQRAEYYTRLGRLYERGWMAEDIITEYQKAVDSYSRAEELFPSNPLMPLNLGRLYDRVGRYDVALGKYFRARMLHYRQYHIPRKFTPKELGQLNARIDALKVANTKHVKPPPLNFTMPRLLGWPKGL